MPSQTWLAKKKIGSSEFKDVPVPKKSKLLLPGLVNQQFANWKITHFNG
jgi:hemolysin-activating ACP:hemolysin acyltransferase